MKARGAAPGVCQRARPLPRRRLTRLRKIHRINAPIGGLVRRGPAGGFQPRRRLAWPPRMVPPWITGCLPRPC